ncbi:MAG: hypothetical protein WAT81_03355 [Candidatus Moraniibacteriota bacterium]
MWTLFISASLAAAMATGLILAALKLLGLLPQSLAGIWPYLIGIGALAFPAYDCRISVEREISQRMFQHGLIAVIKKIRPGSDPGDLPTTSANPSKES